MPTVEYQNFEGSTGSYVFKVTKDDSGMIIGSERVSYVPPQEPVKVVREAAYAGEPISQRTTVVNPGESYVPPTPVIKPQVIPVEVHDTKTGQLQYKGTSEITPEGTNIVKGTYYSQEPAKPKPPETLWEKTQAKYEEVNVGISKTISPVLEPLKPKSAGVAQDVVRGGIEGLQERPLDVAVTAGAMVVAGPLISKAPKVIQLGIGAVYAGQKAEEFSKSKNLAKDVGRTITTELAPMGAGASVGAKVFGGAKAAKIEKPTQTFTRSPIMGESVLKVGVQVDKTPTVNLRGAYFEKVRTDETWKDYERLKNAGRQDILARKYPEAEPAPVLGARTVNLETDLIAPVRDLSVPARTEVFPYGRSSKLTDRISTPGEELVEIPKARYPSTKESDLPEIPKIRTNFIDSGKEGKVIIKKDITGELKGKWKKRESELGKKTVFTNPQGQFTKQQSVLLMEEPKEVSVSLSKSKVRTVDLRNELIIPQKLEKVLKPVSREPKLTIGTGDTFRRAGIRRSARLKRSQRNALSAPKIKPVLAPQVKLDSVKVLNPKKKVAERSITKEINALKPKEKTKEISVTKTGLSLKQTPVLGTKTQSKTKTKTVTESITKAKLRAKASAISVPKSSSLTIPKSNIRAPRGTNIFRDDKKDRRLKKFTEITGVMLPSSMLNKPKSKKRRKIR